MDIKILDSHLREYLISKVKPYDLARYVSLCGPTFDRTHKHGNDYVYEIEVTTNRVDAASVMGIAREAAAILPQFGIDAKLNIPSVKMPTGKKGLTLKLVSNNKLVHRLTAVVIDDIKNWDSPKWMIERLAASGIRSLNAVVDITNYVMLTTGHPCHAFDYDAIGESTIKVRESRPGEKITTFDGKEYTLSGGDILFEDGNGKIIDLPGIMGLKNSVVSKDTKRVLFFFDNNNSVKIRQTSMNLGIRTMAAVLNEKNVDPEIVPQALSLGLDLYEKICKAKIASEVFDVYPKPYTGKNVETTKEFIEKILGVTIGKEAIDKILASLEFKTKWNNNKLTVTVPSFRAHDVHIPEDIVEEIARIYGYHNLPSQLMATALPEPIFDSPLKFEQKVRETLKTLGGVEVLTYSLVSKEMVLKEALKLSNPLGADTEYLRNSLKPSLVNALKGNIGVEAPYHLFEIANVYIPKGNALPEERMMVAGILVNFSFRDAKGIIEAFLESINATVSPNIQMIGDKMYYEFEVNKLKEAVKPKTYTPISKYPPQIEDMTIELNETQKVGDVIHSIKQASKLVSNVELVDIYERSHTFRIYYHDPKKTLSDKEVEEVRKKIEKKLKF